MIHLIASQAWCLSRFFPLVPEDEDRWTHYILLLQILELTFAPVTTIDKTYYLEMLIEEFLDDFKSLYPSRPLTPKMHYLVHVPSWMRKYVVFCYVQYYRNSLLQVRTFSEVLVHAIRI